MKFKPFQALFAFTTFFVVAGSATPLANSAAVARNVDSVPLGSHGRSLDERSDPGPDDLQGQVDLINRSLSARVPNLPSGSDVKLYLMKGMVKWLNDYDGGNYLIADTSVIDVDSSHGIIHVIHSANTTFNVFNGLGPDYAAPKVIYQVLKIDYGTVTGYYRNDDKAKHPGDDSHLDATGKASFEFRAGYTDIHFVPPSS